MTFFDYMRNFMAVGVVLFTWFVVADSWAASVGEGIAFTLIGVKKWSTAK